MCFEISFFAIIAIVLAIVVWSSSNKKTKELKEKLDKKLRSENFTVDKSIEYNKQSQNRVYSVKVDKSNEKIAFIDLYKPKSEKYDFNQLVECKIIEDGTVIQQGGIGRAIVGGVLAGGVGAVVGASTRKSTDVINRLEIQIIVDDVINPMFKFVLIDKKTIRNDLTYKESIDFIDKVYATVTSIIHSNSKS